MKLQLLDTSSAYYSGPKTTAPFMVYVECKHRAVAVELDSEDLLPAALVKAGVNLHRDLHPDEGLKEVTEPTPPVEPTEPTEPGAA